MSNHEVELSSILHLIRNGCTKEQNQAGLGYPVSRIETISNGCIDASRTRFVELISKEFVKWCLEDGDILFSHINSIEHIGKSAIYSGFPPILIHGMNLLLLRADKRVIIPAYLHAVLQSDRIRTTVRSQCKQAVNQASINQKEVGSIRIPLPPLEDQRHIVDILDRATSIRKLRQQAQEVTKKIIPALFIKMFGDPGSNPMGWPVRCLAEVAEVYSGAGFPIQYQGQESGQIPFYKVSDMNLPKNKTDMTESNNYITEDVRIILKARKFPAGTVIFPKIGAAIATNKKRILTVPSCFDNNVMGVIPNKESNSQYVYSLLLLKNLSDFASDSNPPSIRKTTIEEWKIPVPPRNKQVDFANQLAILRLINERHVQGKVICESIMQALQAQLLG